MANSGLQLLGFALALLGWFATIVATFLPQWQVSSYATGSIITAQAIYRGLWMDCAWQSTGQIQCKVYDTILGLSPALQATRALMVVSIVLGLIAMGIAVMGMKCTRCGPEDRVQKARIAMTGGIIFLVAGLAALIACSWIANQVVRDFYGTGMAVNSRYEFGPALFLGWAGSLLALLGGGLLSCSCPENARQGYNNRAYPAGKPISGPPSNKEYV
ncbi:Claudin-7 [Varanus komodoensis]|uniref:Claudin n=1 Tax=Varanus komodoensis TaxID=61221 RepID=A0A8D2LBP1_VARKO|nr:claudin-7 [Varanus komodoensis]KAF7236789.1 Claudin-7 [Varanus komodoensis]